MIKWKLKTWNVKAGSYLKKKCLNVFKQNEKPKYVQEAQIFIKFILYIKYIIIWFGSVRLVRCIQTLNRKPNRIFSVLKIPNRTETEPKIWQRVGLFWPVCSVRRFFAHSYHNILCGRLWLAIYYLYMNLQIFKIFIRKKKRKKKET